MRQNDLLLIAKLTVPRIGVAVKTFMGQEYRE